MKKSFPANINGKIFYIDEDAYTLLLDYLSQLRATFTGDEGAEIVNDIEQRISEHFEERTASGANVITIEDVNRVIETMGRPEELTDADPEANTDPSNTTPPPYTSGAKTQTGGGQTPPQVNKRLYRDVRHKVFGGVIAGLAQYLGWDVTVMRILYAVLTVCTYFWPCVIVYMIAWMIIPVARTPREILEMQGQPVTLDNIGQTVINNSTPPAAPVPDTNFSTITSLINTFFSIAAKFIVGFFGVVAVIVTFTMLCLILSITAGIALFSITGMTTVLDGLDVFDANATVPAALAAICLFFSIMIPFFFIARYSAIPLLRWKAPSTATVITAIIFELLFITASIVIYGYVDHIDSDTAFAMTQLPAVILPCAAAVPAVSVMG